MVCLPNGEKKLGNMFVRFDTIHECNTETGTPHDGIGTGHAMHSSVQQKFWGQANIWGPSKQSSASRWAWECRLCKSLFRWRHLLQAKATSDILTAILFFLLTRLSNGLTDFHQIFTKTHLCGVIH